MFRFVKSRRANSLHMMLAVVALLLLSATSAAAGSPIVHQVSAGGPDACIAWGVSDHPGCDGNYSFQAKLYADGSVSGQYSDRFATGDGIHGVIDCLVVERQPGVAQRNHHPGEVGRRESGRAALLHARGR